MAYISTIYPTTYVRPVRTTRIAMGDAASDYTGCLAAQSAYKTALAAWKKDKAAYDAAVAANASTMSSYASAMATYQANHAVWAKVKAKHDAWVATMASKYSAYARSVAQLLAANPSIKLAAGAPPCVSSTVHTQYANACSAAQLHGLGAYDWSPYSACFVAAYPVCTTDPVEPTKPGPEPQPPVAPTLMKVPDMTTTQPTAPAACVAPVAAPAAPMPAPIAPTPAEASIAPESKSAGGLLMAGLLAIAVAGWIYAIARRKRAA